MAKIFRRCRLILFGLVTELLVVTAFGDPTAYELTLEGKTCKEDLFQQIECQYRIGQSLHISIPGIGVPDTGITFLKSDYDGDFYATFGMQHGCVIVKHGRQSKSIETGSDYAFISPKNGKVYQSWEDCKSAY